MAICMRSAGIWTRASYLEMPCSHRRWMPALVVSYKHHWSGDSMRRSSASEGRRAPGLSCHQPSRSFSCKFGGLFSVPSCFDFTFFIFSVPSWFWCPFFVLHKTHNHNKAQNKWQQAANDGSRVKVPTAERYQGLEGCK